MQLTSQLCMLRQIGFQKDEIDHIFHLDKIDDESRLRIIIEKFIEISNEPL